MDAPLDPGLVADCLAIQTKPQEGDIEIEILQRHKEGSIEQKKFKSLDPETKTLPSDTKIYINESSCKYYKKLWSKCKKL